MPSILTKIQKKLLPVSSRNRNVIPLPAKAVYAPAIELFVKIKTIPGWFTFDDCAHFSMALGFQRALEITGHLLEIGAFHGRSAAFMANYLNSGEKLVICDLFEAGDTSLYGDCPTPDRVVANILSVNPNLAADSIKTIKGDSLKLISGSEDMFRFVHVDGGHSYDECMLDLRSCIKRLIDCGIMVVDDYMHPDWPEVTDAVNDFLKERKDMQIMADLNRTTAIGRKLYLIRKI